MGSPLGFLASAACLYDPRISARSARIRTACTARDQIPTYGFRISACLHDPRISAYGSRISACLYGLELRPACTTLKSLPTVLELEPACMAHKRFEGRIIRRLLPD